MNLLACGINHETAPLSLREKLVFSSDYLAGSLQEMLLSTRAEEAMILSTCNRTEFYCVNTEEKPAIDWLYQHKKLPRDSLQAHWYTYKQEHALRHILRVASGLDSKILGEPQIMGQIKTAFALADSLGAVGTHFKRLFQYVLTVTKQVRHATAITAHPVSLAFAIVTSAKRIFAHFQDSRVLLIGAGSTISLIAKHLFSQGVRCFWVANRTPYSAEKLALTIGGQPISLQAIPSYLPHVDVVIAATASPFPIIRKDMLENALKQHRRHPLFVADLGVPRDIEAEANTLEDVYLYTLDDLHALIQKNQCCRKAAAIKAEALIEAKVQDYLDLFKIKAATPIICAYRQQAEYLRDKELNKAFFLLKKGVSQEEVLKRLAYALTSKLLHTPSVALRKAACLGQQEILNTAIKLFKLNLGEE